MIYTKWSGCHSPINNSLKPLPWPGKCRRGMWTRLNTISINHISNSAPSSKWSKSIIMILPSSILDTHQGKVSLELPKSFNPLALISLPQRVSSRFHNDSPTDPTFPVLCFRAVFQAPFRTWAPDGSGGGSGAAGRAVPAGCARRLERRICVPSAQDRPLRPLQATPGVRR